MFVSLIMQSVNRAIQYATPSFPGPPDGQVALDVLLHHLRHRHLEVLLGHVDTSLPQSEHTGFGAHGLAFGSRSAHHLFGNSAEIDASHQIHFAGVNFEDLQSGFESWVGEFYFSIDTARSQQSRIQDVDSVGCHDDLDSLSRLETVQLIQQLKHSPLHLRVSSLTLHSGPSDGVDLIDENDAGRMLPSHHEQLSDHSCSLTDVFLHQL